MIALAVGYKSGERFDADYYRAKHMPLVGEKLMPEGLQRMEVRRIVGAPDGGPAPYQVITTLYFNDLPALQRALDSPGGRAVVADIANFYPGSPDLMVGEAIE